MVNKSLLQNIVNKALILPVDAAPYFDGPFMCPGGDHREIDRMRIRFKTKQGRVWFEIAPPLEHILTGRMP